MSRAASWTGPRRLGRVYGGLLRTELQVATTYRSQLLIGAMTCVVPVAFMALWRGTAEGGPVAGITSGQFTTYFAVVLMTTSLQLTNHLSFGVDPLVHSGELSALLLRPHHPMHVLVARGVAQLTYKVAPLLVVVPLLVAGLGGPVSRDGTQWLLAVTVAPLGFVCTVYLALMMGSLALWVTRSAAISGLLFGAEWIFGGLVAPVGLLPWFLPDLARHLPLWFAIGAPAEALSGISRLGAGVLVEAAAWAVALHLLYAAVWRRGLGRYEAVGT